MMENVAGAQRESAGQGVSELSFGQRHPEIKYPFLNTSHTTQSGFTFYNYFLSIF